MNQVCARHKMCETCVQGMIKAEFEKVSHEVSLSEGKLVYDSEALKHTCPVCKVDMPSEVVERCLPDAETMLEIMQTRKRITEEQSKKDGRLAQETGDEEFAAMLQQAELERARMEREMQRLMMLERILMLQRLEAARREQQRREQLELEAER